MMRNQPSALVRHRSSLASVCDCAWRVRPMRQVSQEDWGLVFVLGRWGRVFGMRLAAQCDWRPAGVCEFWIGRIVWLWFPDITRGSSPFAFALVRQVGRRRWSRNGRGCCDVLSFCGCGERRRVGVTSRHGHDGAGAEVPRAGANTCAAGCGVDVEEERRIHGHRAPVWSGDAGLSG